MEKLDELIGKDYPIMTYALSSSTTATTDQLASLIAEKEAIENVLSTINTDFETYILNTSIDMNGYVYTYDTYSIDNIRDWQIEVVTPISLTSLSSSASNVFTCDGNVTTTFPAEKIIYCDNTTYVSRCIVSSSSHNSGTTTVTISAGDILPSISQVYDITSVHISSSFTDENIIKWMDDFDFAYDHLHHPMNQTGTYGILARISMLQSASDTVTLNKNKQDQMDSVYRQYTTWTPIVSGSDIEYINEISFSCPSDMTSIFTSGSDLLIDCGVDKQKGSKVQTSTYILPSAASYTECVIVYDIEAYMETPATSALPTSAMNFAFDDTILSLYIGGDEILGVEYVDPMTFKCPNDLTSELTTGTSLIGIFPDVDEDDFSPRYFNVYGSEHKSNPQADRTIVTINEGLPITSNIEVVNIIVE